MESILKWAVILVVGFLAFKWFTGIVGEVIGAGSGDPFDYGPTYNPNSYIGVPYNTITVWREPTRGRGRRYSYGGR